MPRPKKDAESAESLFPILFNPRQLNDALPKAAQVYELLRTAIVQMSLRPGMVLSEKAVCDQLQISRTPLREAILQLAAEGLLDVLPNNGTFVTSIDLRHVFDGQLVRASLELRAVRLAARTANKLFLQSLEFNLHQQHVLAADSDYARFYEVDEAMHQLICEFGASPRVWKIVTGAKAHLDRVRRLQIPEKDHLGIILEEHTAVIEALVAKDERRAAQAMARHVNRVFQTVRHLLKQRSEFFTDDAAHQLAKFDQLSK